MHKDPRGPVRRIKRVKMTTRAALVLLDCGHIRRFNQIYSYKVGAVSRCLACLKEDTNG